MEKRRSRYQTLGWRLARERIGQLVRKNYRIDQEMSPRLAAFVKKLENGSAEFPTEMQFPAEKQTTSAANEAPQMPARRFPPP